ncbi:hypothetical protein AGDE_14924 [Angomonas deanei]|uniref:Uncharacterized protein n=1 Tax=Angomonas deanei TaxID=59799 RepID=A0A7G2CMU4_9TRYP|nr:hypothetical protein AGDE_14924 [Angomonas deanei]CAD2220729.1 hypothetical protein, conserved [Angomonas deanei]|eukprot:EPY19986.1 hypothetical protein AGDE_14924 [Angomonas deanei]
MHSSTDDDTLLNHRVWASRIKEQHFHLQKCIANRREGDHTEDNHCHEPSAGDFTDDVHQWKCAVSSSEEQGRLTAYAESMHHLATMYWANADHGTQRGGNPKRGREECGEGGGDTHNKYYTDRVAYCLSCLSAYFLGTWRRPGADTLVYETLPLIFSRAIKPLRRDYFHRLHRVATPAEVEGLVDEVRTGVGEGWRTALEYRRVAAGADPGAVPPPLAVLDVGSCYGPFAGRVVEGRPGVPVPLDVTSIDIQPYGDHTGADRPVWKGDWVGMTFFTDEGGRESDGQSPALRRIKLSGSPSEASTTVEGIRVASFDAVFFASYFRISQPLVCAIYAACMRTWRSRRGVCW